MNIVIGYLCIGFLWACFATWLQVKYLDQRFGWDLMVTCGLNWVMWPIGMVAGIASWRSGGF